MQLFISLCYNTPMKRQLAIDTIRAHAAELAALHVRHLSLFGSIARDEATRVSDLDVLADIDLSDVKGVYAFGRIERVKEYLERLFGLDVDVLVSNDLRPTAEMTPNIKRDAVPVF